MKKVIYLLLLLAGILIPAFHFGYNKSESVPFSYYFYHRTKEFRQGNYLIFNMQSDPLGVLPAKAKLVKQAACLSGMELVSTEKYFLCDGVYITKRIDPENMKFEFSGIIPDGKVFVLGTHQRSYDSRIWGLLDEDNIIGIVHPIF